MKGLGVLRITGPHSLDQIGQFALGDKYVVQLMGGSAVEVCDLQDMIDIICEEFRTAPDYDFEVFRGAAKANGRTLFILPRHVLGVPYGRNLKRLRENLQLWLGHYNLTGEWLAEVPMRSIQPTRFDRTAWR